MLTKAHLLPGILGIVNEIQRLAPLFKGCSIQVGDAKSEEGTHWSFPYTQNKMSVSGVFYLIKLVITVGDDSFNTIIPPQHAELTFHLGTSDNPLSILFWH